VEPDFARHYYEASTPDHWWFRGRATLISWLAAGHQLEHERALDLGAGSLTMLPNRLETVRLDMVVPNPVGEGPFVKASALRLPFRDTAFGVVGLFDLIEHVEDEAGLLSEINRVLRPGGAVVLTAPAHQWLWSDHDVKARHVRRYGVRELVSTFEQSGFRVEFVRQFYGFLLIPAVLRKFLGLAGGMGRPPEPLNRLLVHVARASVRRAHRGRSRLGLSIALLARR
jgi:SAM-dependent methyltransferase